MALRYLDDAGGMDLGKHDAVEWVEYEPRPRNYPCVISDLWVYVPLLGTVLTCFYCFGSVS